MHHPHKKNNNGLKFVIIVISVLVVFTGFLISVFSKNKSKIQPADTIPQVKKAEQDLLSNWVDVNALIYTARQYYILAKEDDIYMAYFNSDYDIPNNFYIKTLYKLEKLGFTNLAGLQDKFNSKSPDLRSSFFKALTYIVENLYEKSLKNYLKIEALSPNLLTAKDYYYIGMVYLKKKEFYTNLAINYFNKALKKGLTEPEVYLSLGNANFLLLQYDESLKNYLIAEKKIDFNPVLFYNIAWLHHNKKEWKKSSEYCIRSIEKLPRIIEHQKKNFSRITDKKLLDAVIPVVQPQMLGKFYNLNGMNIEELKDPDNAILNYESALKYITGDDRIYQNLGCLYYAKKNFSAAKTNLEKAMQINPYNAKSNELLKVIK